MSVKDTKAYKEGLQAAQAKKSRANPYKRYTKEEAWDAGFNDGVAEDLAPGAPIMFGIIAAQIAVFVWVLFFM